MPYTNLPSEGSPMQLTPSQCLQERKLNEVIEFISTAKLTGENLMKILGATDKAILNYLEAEKK